MTPKQYLQQIQNLKAKYRRAQETVQQIRELMTSAGAIRYDKLNVQSSPDGDKMALYMDRLMKAESRYVKASEQYFETFVQISNQINMISPQTYSDILYLRYVHGMKLWDIAEELNYNYDRIRHLHGMALVEFGKCFPESLGGKQ